MRIQKNIGIQETSLQDQYENTAGKAGKSHKAHNATTGNIAVSGADLKGESLIQKRQGLAKKQALKVVADAFEGEKKLDAQMQSIMDEIKRLQDEINEKTNSLNNNNQMIKDLQEEYGIDPEDEKAKQLFLLPTNIVYKDDNLSDEEMDRLSEYQERASALFFQNDQLSRDINKYKAIQMGNVQGFSDMKRERLKSQDMLKAQDAAEDIMEAANGETIALLTQEAVDHVDEEQKEREEETKEASEKKKEEKKEEAKKLEKEAIQEEMIENIRDQASESQRTSADIKRAIARRERAEADRMDAGDIQKTIISDATSMEDTQNAVNNEIANILNRLSLLANDVKGSAIDDQI